MSQGQESIVWAMESDEIDDILADAEDDYLDNDEENEEEDQQTQQLVYEYDEIQDDRIAGLLKKTTLELDDGRIIPILSRGPKYSEEKWPVNCHICRFSSMHTFERIMDHLSSSTHEVNAEIILSGRKMYDPMRPFTQTVDLKDPELTPIRIYGGEVITEITRDLVGRYRKQIPIEAIGISYAYKILPDRGKNYFCMLCRERGTLIHFREEQHVQKYIMKHFVETRKKLIPLVIRRLKAHQRDFIQKAITQIYRKIADEKFERFPEYVPLNELNANFNKFWKASNQKDHISEKMITIDNEWLNKILWEYDEHGDQARLKSTQGETQKAEIDKTQKDENATYNDNNDCSDNNDLTPESRTEAAAWDEYRRKMVAILNDLDHLYDVTYREDLENHPSYKREWQKFWKSRAAELRKAGVDTRSYDYKAEWLPFWERRLAEFKHRELYTKKGALKRKLNLIERARTPTQIRHMLNSRNTPPMPEPPSSGLSPPMQQNASNRSDDDDDQLSVVSVMRIAAALEDHLGSLGPQAIQLLSRAVISEKENPNPDTLLMDNHYYIFFLTVNVKLKGQIQAKLITQRTLNAFEHAVKQISAILHRFEEFRAGGLPSRPLLSGDVRPLISPEVSSSDYINSDNIEMFGNLSGTELDIEGDCSEKSGFSSIISGIDGMGINTNTDLSKLTSQQRHMFQRAKAIGHSKEEALEITLSNYKPKVSLNIAGFEEQSPTLKMAIKHKNTHANATNRQAMSIVKLGFHSPDSSNDSLTLDQMAVLQKVILEVLGEHRPNSHRILFKSCAPRSGWLLLVCLDSATAEWVRGNLEHIKSACSFEFILLEEVDFPRPYVIRGSFPQSSSIDTEKVLASVSSQNCLPTDRWRVIKRDEKDHYLHLIFEIDAISMSKLLEWKGVVGYGFTTITLNLKGKGGRI